MLNSKTDDYGVLKIEDEFFFDLRLSPGSVNRTLRILDSLVKSLESLEICSSNAPGEWANSYLYIFNEKLRFSLKERIKRTDHIPTKKEIDDQKRDYWRIPPKWGYISFQELLNININGFEIDRDLFWKQRSADQVERICKAQGWEVAT